MRPAVVFARFTLITLLLVAAFSWRPVHAADPRGSGPLALVITYHAAPVNRAALRKAMEESEAPQFERWKKEGVLKDARILFNRYADAASFDAMALLTFARYADLERWNAIEKAAPGGLSPRAAALVSSIETGPADLMRQKAGPNAPSSAPYLVIPYEYLVSAGEYVAYLDGYTVPQLDGWMEEGVLSRYGILLARYPAGRPWNSLLVLEYKDDAALGERDVTTAKVRARLKDNPKWKAISDAKKNVRNEKPPVIADLITAR